MSTNLTPAIKASDHRSVRCERQTVPCSVFACRLLSVRHPRRAWFPDFAALHPGYDRVDCYDR
jgi:hypothetical protein